MHVGWRRRIVQASISFSSSLCLMMDVKADFSVKTSVIRVYFFNSFSPLLMNCTNELVNEEETVPDGDEREKS